MNLDSLFDVKGKEIVKKKKNMCLFKEIKTIHSIL